MTSHKSQGTSIAKLCINLGEKEWTNMSYVMLSRTNMKESLKITGNFSKERWEKAYKENQDIAKFEKTMRAR